MKKVIRLTAGAAFALLSAMVSVPVGQAHAQDDSVPMVFQAAGPTAASIQSTVDAFRLALGDPINGNAAGPLPGGRREINWDGGGGNQNTAVADNPFAGFQLTRGALFTAPHGTGFVQAPAAADPNSFPPGGLAGLFNNPTYGTIFSTFSPLRLFSAIGSKVIDTTFTVPGDATSAATVSGFGAVFTDVDGRQLPRQSGAKTRIEYFGADGELLFASTIPASPGDGSLSFFGIKFGEARIARVRIRSGDAALGPDEIRPRDIVVMDDFIYGEPQPLP